MRRSQKGSHPGVAAASMDMRLCLGGGKGALASLFSETKQLPRQEPQETGGDDESAESRPEPRLEGLRPPQKGLVS